MCENPARNMMLALRATSTGVYSLCDLPVPEPLANEVLIEVALAGICGTDVEILDGCMAYFTSTPPRGTYPITLGHEWSGKVVAAGSADARLADGSLPVVGDAVVGECSLGCRACAFCSSGSYHRCNSRQETGIIARNGALARFIVMPACYVHRLPLPLSLRAGALVEPTAVALNGLRAGGVKAGSRVAVFGDGPIGLLLLQAALAAGAIVVIVGADLLRLRLAQRLGAAAAIDARDCANIPAAIAAALGGTPPDVILEAAGSRDAVAAAVASAAPGAVIILQGLCGAAAVGAAPSPAVDTDVVVVQDLTLRGALGSPGLWPAAIALLASGAIDVDALVTHELPLREFEAALALLRSRTAVKVMLRPADV